MNGVSGRSSVPAVFGQWYSQQRVASQRLYAVAAGTLVTTAFLPLLALLNQKVRRILLAVILLEMVFVLDVNVGYREDTALFGALPGYNVSLTTLALVGLYTSWLIGFLAREPSTPRRVRLSWPLMVYLGFVGLAMMLAHDVELSEFEIFMLVQLFLLHVYAASALRTRSDVLFVVKLLLVGLALEALMIMATVVTGANVSLGRISAQIDHGRAGGTFGSPNGAASYLVFLLPSCAGLVLSNISRRSTALALAAFGLGTISLIFTLSRGAWIAFVLSMLLMGVAAWRRGYFSLKVPILVAAVVMVLVLPFLGIITQRVGGDDGGSAVSRIPLAILAYRVIEDHPWLGIGPNNFALIEKSYLTSEFAGEWFFVVHNKYLLVWAESGVFALIAFLLFLGSTLRRGWQQWRLGDPTLAPVALGFTAALVGHVWHMFFEVFHRPQVQALWLVAGLLIAMASVRTDHEATASG